MSSLITTTDMASIAGYDISTITNWKKRYDDFPMSKLTYARTELYEETEFRQWLKMHEARKRK